MLKAASIAMLRVLPKWFRGAVLGSDRISVICPVPKEKTNNVSLENHSVSNVHLYSSRHHPIPLPKKAYQYSLFR